MWLAAIFSFVGTWVEDVGESWVMLSMSRDPRLVALLATCFLAPTLALTLPAGFFADRYDRRRILLWSQAACAVAAIGPAIAIRLHTMTPGVLLVFSAFLGAAVALGAPAWGTLVPELLPKSQTAEAITLGSISFNIARVVGPALGGLLLASTGPEITFAVNAVSFLAVFWVLWRFEEVKRASELARPSSRSRSIMGAFADPFREVWQTPKLRGVFITGAAFSSAACVVIAILPAFAKHSLGTTASGYGALLSALGLGSIAAGVLLKRARERFGVRALVTAGIVTYGASIALASRAAHVLGAVPFFFIAGLGWIACLTSLSATVQLTASTETKSRVTALYQLNFYASATIGATIGGAIAEHWSERVAIAVGGFAVLCAAPIAARALASPVEARRAEREVSNGDDEQHHDGDERVVDA